MRSAAPSADTEVMSGRVGRLAVPAVSAALAVVLLAALAVAALRAPVAGAATVLLRGDAVTAVLADGARVPLAPGDEVPRGALVDAGRDGAVLRTRDRDTWLSGDAELVVVDGAAQDLRAGFAMVDARRGPGVRLTTAAAEVTTPEGAVSRVEGGGLLRVGAYAGDGVRVRPVGRRATTDLPVAYQVQVPRGGLPGRATPLVLTPGDAYERALAPDLVLADEALRDVARSLDGGGRPAVLVRTAAATDVPAAAPVPAGAPASEAGLAYLLARAADGGLADRFAEVRALRADGGSWGVVAELVGAQVAEVAALLDALLAEPGDPVLADGPALPGSPLAPGAPAGPGPGGGTTSGSDGDGGPSAPGTPPGSGGGDQPPSGPPPTSDPDVVRAVVDTVLGLLPTTTTAETVQPTVPPVPASAPSPAPSPTPTGGLVGGVVGGLLGGG